MKVRPVDPRDAAWEDETPRYRVYFWTPAGGADENEISGVDVQEVIEWAEANRGERTYSLYVCVDLDDMGLVRLAGRDPNSPPPRGERPPLDPNAISIMWSEE
jgi:hypothetical protein